MATSLQIPSHWIHMHTDVQTHKIHYHKPTHAHTHTTINMYMICSTLAYGQAVESTLGIAAFCTFFFSHSLFKEMSLQIRRLPSDIRTQVSVWEPGHHRHLSSHAEFLGLFRLGAEIPFLDGRAFQKTFATSHSLLRVLCLITFVITTMRYIRFRW